MIFKSEAHERDVARDLRPTGASVKKNSIMPARVKRSADPRNKYCNDTRLSSGHLPRKWNDDVVVDWKYWKSGREAGDTRRDPILVFMVAALWRNSASDENWAASCWLAW